MRRCCVCLLFLALVPLCWVESLAYGDTSKPKAKSTPKGKAPTPWYKKLGTVKLVRYATVAGYSEGPSWRDGKLFFCCNLGLLRVGKDRKVRKVFDLKPAGTRFMANGHLLICNNKPPALLDMRPDYKVGVVADRYQGKPLGGLNDLTIDRAGNVYWTDPKESSVKNPVGKIYRVTPAGKVERLADNLAFPNGIEVDPENRYLYVVESQTAKILRYPVPTDKQPLGQPTIFYALGGSGGDGCAIDAEGNLWVADFHRPETGKGRITILTPQGKRLGHLDVPAKQVSNLTFGGPKNDELFVTTINPAAVFHARVGIAGFKGHPGKPLKILRYLSLKPLDVPVPGK